MKFSGILVCVTSMNNLLLDLRGQKSQANWQEQSIYQVSDWDNFNFKVISQNKYIIFLEISVD